MACLVRFLNGILFLICELVSDEALSSGGQRHKCPTELHSEVKKILIYLGMFGLSLSKQEKEQYLIVNTLWSHVELSFSKKT